MVLDKNQFLERLKEKVGTDENDIQLLEDFTDTYTHLEQSAGVDWKAKFEENDKQWKEKYRERFFTPQEIKREQEEDVKKDGEELSFNDLFKEREG